jgi:hypothetical protein
MAPRVKSSVATHPLTHLAQLQVTSALATEDQELPASILGPPSSIAPSDSASQVACETQRKAHQKSNHVIEPGDRTDASALEEENQLRGGFFFHTYRANVPLFTF